MAGARVIVQSTGSSITREATADDRGEFRIEGLLPGSYRITVTAKGFADAAADVDVEVSVVRDIAVTLKPESGRETVNVQGKLLPRSRPSRLTRRALCIRAWSAARDLETLPLAGAQLCQHRLPRARNRAGRALRSHQGAHHRRLHRRKLGLEQRTIRRWRRQLRRLDRRLSAKFFARWHSGIRRAHRQ